MAPAIPTSASGSALSPRRADKSGNVAWANGCPSAQPNWPRTFAPIRLSRPSGPFNDAADCERRSAWRGAATLKCVPSTRRPRSGAPATQPGLPRTEHRRTACPEGRDAHRSYNQYRRSALLCSFIPRAGAASLAGMPNPYLYVLDEPLARAEPLEQLASMPARRPRLLRGGTDHDVAPAAFGERLAVRDVRHVTPSTRDAACFRPCVFRRLALRRTTPYATRGMRGEGRSGDVPATLASQAASRADLVRVARG